MSGLGLLGWAAIALLVALALLLLYVAAQPAQFRVTRNAVIKAPAARIFALIDDLRAFNNWNPYEKKDPGVQGEYSGPARGVGAAYAWRGRKIGQGRLEITDSRAPTKLLMRLDFVKPFEAHNIAEFTLLPHGDELTVVSWAMHGPAPFLQRLAGVFIDMDRVVGKDFEAGLANLKSLTERRVR